MKIICMSDTHRSFWDFKLPQADMLLFAGDIDTHDSVAQLIGFCNWLDEQPVTHKIIVAGNHDGFFEEQGPLARDIIKSHATYLENSGTEIEGLKIYGSPISLMFMDWWFMKSPMQIRPYWDAIPSDTDILITHEPPYGICDLNERGGHLGCPLLRERVLDVIKPKIHVFGHIHDAYGTEKIGETLFVNASIMDDYYDPVHEPVIVELNSSGAEKL